MKTYCEVAVTFNSRQFKLNKALEQFYNIVERRKSLCKICLSQYCPKNIRNIFRRNISQNQEHPANFKKMFKDIPEVEPIFSRDSNALPVTVSVATVRQVWL